MYNQQSHAIAFGAGDANRTNFGLLPMSYITHALGLGFLGSELARQVTGWSARPVPAVDEVVLVEAAEEFPLSDRQLVQCPP